MNQDRMLVSYKIVTETAGVFVVLLMDGQPHPHRLGPFNSEKDARKSAEGFFKVELLKIPGAVVEKIQ